jgi:DNA repair photolyase
MPRTESVRQITNPPNPWRDCSVEWLGEPPSARLEVYQDDSKGVLSRNTSPDLPFDWSVNPYRGCYHGCAYCYARPTHEFLGWGAGTDFDRKIVVKPRAAQCLTEAFEAPSWQGEFIMFSGNTDCYQPLEASYALTRACLEVCLAYHQPVGVITKSTLVERDAEILAAISDVTHCHVVLSIPFADASHCRAIEPYAPTPARRFETIRRLSELGIRVGVNVAPVIPGLNDSDIPSILEQAKAAGASFAHHQLVRLPGPVMEVFEKRLHEALPKRASRVMNQIKACRGGKLNESRFNARMQGHGARWEAIEALFFTIRNRLLLESEPSRPSSSSFKRPKTDAQLTLL